MSIRSVSIAGEPVGCIATGLMRLTWAPTDTPDDQAFELIKTAIDSGSNFLNSGAFYNRPDEPHSNLKLISRFLEKYPNYSDKFLLSVKGGLSPEFKPSGELEFLRNDVTKINEALKHKKMDFFEIARVPKDVSVEEMVKNLLTLQSEGHFKHISLSEVSAATFRKAAAVQPGAIALIEVEYSPFCVDIEKNGLLDAAKELGVPILAYSPLGAGFLGNNWKSKDDIPEGDMRKGFDKFSDENFAHNVQLAEKLGKVAEKKGVTAAQLSIAWVAAQWEKIIPLPGSTKPSRVAESVAAGNITFSKEELDEIRQVIDSFEVKGVRYANNPHMQASLNG
ncbi:hypothetical protein JCM8547_001974 [Rhodosporidiobolus lusitaniae]